MLDFLVEAASLTSGTRWRASPATGVRRRSAFCNLAWLSGGLAELIIAPALFRSRGLWGPVSKTRLMGKWGGGCARPGEQSVWT